MEHVFIFCYNVNYHKKWALNNENKKVKCVTNNYDEIIRNFQFYGKYNFKTEVKFMSKNELKDYHLLSIFLNKYIC